MDESRDSAANARPAVTTPLLSNLFVPRIPSQCPPLAVAVHRHSAGDRHAEADFEGAVGLGGAANGIEEVLDVGFGFVGAGARIAQRLGTMRTVDFLGKIADLLAAGDGSVGAEHVFSRAELVVTETRVPGEQDFFGLLERHVHGVGYLAAV